MEHPDTGKPALPSPASGLEIEITPEMIEAAANVLENVEPPLDLGRGYALLVCRRVLEAALRAAQTES